MTKTTAPRLGKNMRNALAFCTRHYGWVSYSEKHRATVQAISKLEKLGLVETNGHFQFRLELPR